VAGKKADGKAGKKAESKEGKGGLPLVPIVVVLVVGLVGGTFAGKTLFGGKCEKEPEKPKVGHTLDLGEFLVNLDDEHYLKAGVALGLKEGIPAEKLKEETAPLRDAVLMAFVRASRSELNSYEGKQKIKEHIRERVNEVLHEKTHDKESVLEVYFTSFVTQ
jgi:flagellar basal body-associated protein FliL